MQIPLTNMSNGGEPGSLGYKHTKDALKKIKLASVKSWENNARKEAHTKATLGQKRSAQTCENISNALKGKTFSNERKLKLIENHKDRTAEGKANRILNIKASLKNMSADAKLQKSLKLKATLKNRTAEVKAAKAVNMSLARKGIPWTVARRKAQELRNLTKERME